MLESLTKKERREWQQEAFDNIQSKAEEGFIPEEDSATVCISNSEILTWGTLFRMRFDNAAMETLNRVQRVYWDGSGFTKMKHLRDFRAEVAKLVSFVHVIPKLEAKAVEEK
jgi:hypothetical protein